MIITRWRSVCLIKNSLIAPTSATSNWSAFHSSPISHEKWKSKLNFDFQKVQKPSKSHIKFTTREKRSNAKKALDNLLLNSGSFGISKGSDPLWKFDGREADLRKKSKSKSSPRSAAKSLHKKTKVKLRRERLSEDLEDHPERIFREAFGSSWYTWSFNSWRSGFESSASGFERGENQNMCRWDDDLLSLGSPPDRIALGLPPRGPLKMEDVKNAFRLSALKWHPDKHQGPSQDLSVLFIVLSYTSLCSLSSNLPFVYQVALYKVPNTPTPFFYYLEWLLDKVSDEVYKERVAEEKFKICVDAYKSLCSAFSAA